MMKMQQTIKTMFWIALLGGLSLQCVYAGSRVDSLKLEQLEQELVMEYEVVGAQYQGVGVLMEYRLDGETTWRKPKGLKENIDAGITNGRHVLTWEVLQEFPEGIQRRIDVRVVTRDEIAKSEYPLTIKTTPEAARIRILNIGPRYEDGIELKPGKYHIEVSKSGYKRHREWIKLASREMVHLVDLEKINPPKPSYQQPVQRQEPRPTYDNSYSSSSGSHSAGDTWTDPTTGMEFVWVPKGCFQMGSNDGDSDEKPVHRVCLSNGYWLGKYEITQRQWKKVMGNNPVKYFKGDNRPVQNVSWDDVQKFARQLSNQGNGEFVLPTEAQWEYACRSGGKNEKYCGGNNVGRVAWYKKNSNNETHPVGQKQGNGLGLFDMSGNVWEWVQDWKGGYPSSSVTDPTGPSSASFRVFRGGGWYYVADFARSAYRGRYDPDVRNGYLGARLVRRP